MISLLFPSFFLWMFSVFNQFGIRARYGTSQLTYVIAGLIAFFIIKRIGRRYFIANAKIIYWVFIFLLALTYIIGFEVKGSKRWIDFGFANFQSSEFFKVFFIMYFAKILGSKRKDEMTFGFLLQLCALALIPIFIILRQPDLGNAMVYVGVFFVLLLCSDMPKKFILWLAGYILLILPFGWFGLHDYQRARIVSFVQPHATPEGGDSYNMIQAVITVGSGMFFGKGLGLGTQSRLFFLPENNTDFAFSSLVEQFGFVGGFVVIILELILIVSLFLRALKFVNGSDNDTRYKYLYACGLAALVLIQAGVNIGMNLGILPIAGIALPFISYGGSFFVALCIGFALLKT